MDEVLATPSRIITYLLAGVDTLAEGFVLQAFTNLSTPMGQIFFALLYLFLVIYGYKVMFSGQIGLIELFGHLFKMMIILALATSWEIFSNFVYFIFQTFPDLLAGELISGSGSDVAGPITGDTGDEVRNSATTALQTLFDASWAAAKTIQDRGQGIAGTIVHALYGFLVGVLGTVLCGFALFAIVLSRMMMAVLLALGPFFIICAVFEKTRSLTEGWLRSLMIYALIPVFTFVVLSFILFLINPSVSQLVSNESSDPDIGLMSLIGSFALAAFVGIYVVHQIPRYVTDIVGGMPLNWSPSRHGVRAAQAAYKAARTGVGAGLGAAARGARAAANAWPRNATASASGGANQTGSNLVNSGRQSGSYRYQGKPTLPPQNGATPVINHAPLAVNGHGPKTLPPPPKQLPPPKK